MTYFLRLITAPISGLGRVREIGRLVCVCRGSNPPPVLPHSVKFGLRNPLSQMGWRGLMRRVNGGEEEGKEKHEQVDKHGPQKLLSH